MDDNINSKLDRGLVEWRCKCAVCHGDDSFTFAKFTKLLQIHQGHCWVARCFTKKHLQEKAMNSNITCSDKSVTRRGVQHSTLVTVFTRISNKHRGTYLFFRATSAVLIPGGHLFKPCTRQTTCTTQQTWQKKRRSNT